MTHSEKSIPLSAVQFIGVFIALVAAILLDDFSSIEKSLQKQMMLTIIAVELGSFLCASLNQDVSRVMRLPDRWIGSRRVIMTLSRLFAVYAVLDLFVLGYLVYSTGGSRLSLYTPLLFIIVPVAIVLGEKPRRVLFYGGLTIVIFFVVMYWKDEAFKIADCDINTYNFCWGIITVLAVLFPTLLYLFAARGSRGELGDGPCQETNKIGPWRARAKD